MKFFPKYKTERCSASLCSVINSLFFLEFCKFRKFGKTLCDPFTAPPPVGEQTIRAILDALFVVAEITAAVFAKRIQRAIAEQAIKIFGALRLMAGEILTLAILKKRAVILTVFFTHMTSPLSVFSVSKYTFF